MRDSSQAVSEGVIELLRQHSFEPTSPISKDQLVRILDEQSQLHCQKPFSRKILDEIWEQTETLSSHEATVSSVAAVFEEAVNILNQRIRQIDSAQGNGDSMSVILKQHEQQLAEAEKQEQRGSTNYEEMSFLRKNIAYLQGKLADIASSRRQFISEKADILVCLRKIQASPRGESQTVRLSLAKENSAQLLTIFVLSFVALTLQLMQLSFRNSMFNVLIYCQVFYLLLLGYYNDNSVVYLEAQLCGSLVLDLAFVILTKGFYLAPERHSEDNVYFVVTLVFLAITAVLRLILIVKLWPFWKPPQNTLFFLLFGNELILHRRSGANILNEAASS